MCSVEGSGASSPRISPRSVVGTYDLNGIAVEWDNDAEVRSRLRDGFNICLRVNSAGEPENGSVEATVANLRLNAPVLKPLITRMETHDLRLPSIEKLIAAVEDLYQVAKVPRTVQQAYQEAWAIRRMIGKLKRFTYRDGPPQDRACPCMQPNHG